MAEDASTVYFNPAGLARLDGRQVVVAGHLILPSARFSDAASTKGLNQDTLGDNGGDAGSLALAPNFFMAWPLGQGLVFGLGVSAPFGLVTEYDEDWVGRYHAVKSDLQTININPSLGIRLNERWSLGLGLNAQRAEAELSKMANYGAANVAFTDMEGLATVKGDDWGWGYNLGMLFEPAPGTRIGLSYRSKVDYTLEGTVKYESRPAPLAAVLADGPVSAKASLPASASLSLFKILSPDWDLLADATWIQWSLFDRLTVRRPNGAIVDDTREKWRNSWRLSLGANRHINRNLTLRMGLAFDESPVPTATRTPRIPDEDRIWASLGFQYRLRAGSTLDVGYTHIFADDARMELSSVANGDLVGSYDSHVDILSVQYTHTF